MGNVNDTSSPAYKVAIGFGVRSSWNAAHPTGMGITILSEGKSQELDFSPERAEEAHKNMWGVKYKNDLCGTWR